MISIVRGLVCVPLTIVVIICVGSASTKASSILGFALVGGQGHQLPMLRMGRELASRGHNFTMLLSSADEISRTLLQSKAFPGLEIVSFVGPPHLGTRQWFEGLPRDPQKASNIYPAQSPAHTVRSGNAWSIDNVYVKIDDTFRTRDGVVTCRIRSHRLVLCACRPSAG